jgi:replication factor A1
VIRVSSGHYYIYGVFIDPEYHRRGIGVGSFELVTQRYPDAKKWTLDTPEWNVRTKRFYEKIGFVQKGILRWEPDFDLRFYEMITDDSYSLELTKIVDLEDGMKRVVVEGTISNVEETREVVSRKDSKPYSVANFSLTDESGSVKLVLWNNFIRQVNSGERIRIDPGYVSSFRGELQLNVSRWGQIIILQ